MILKFTNSFNDFVESQLFLDPLKKSRIFYLKFRKIALYAYYLYCILAILWFANESYWDIKLIIILCISILFITIMLHLVIKCEPKFYLYTVKKRCRVAIEKNPNAIKEKVVTLKSDKFVVAVDNSETEINFESIYKIFENNDKIYILEAGYKALLIVPYEAFKDNDEKLNFLIRIKK